MKKIFLLLLACLVLGMVGCIQKRAYNAVQFENQQQQDFDNFLAKKQQASYYQANDIQEKEYYAQFESELFNYVDSVRLFINWKGIIEDIKTEESGKTTALKFTITYKPEEYREVEFHCTHLIDTDSLNSDYIYNTVRNIRNYTVVYFDGFIRTKNNDEVYYYLRSAGNDLNISYPNYEFWITDIGSEKRNDTLSNNLQDAVSIVCKLGEPMKEYFMKSITKEEFDRQSNELLPLYKEAESMLSDREKQYAKRFNTCLMYNYLYGD